MILSENLSISVFHWISMYIRKIKILWWWSIVTGTYLMVAKISVYLKCFFSHGRNFWIWIFSIQTKSLEFYSKQNFWSFDLKSNFQVDWIYLKVLNSFFVWPVFDSCMRCLTNNSLFDSYFWHWSMVIRIWSIFSLRHVVSESCRDQPLFQSAVMTKL